MCRHLSRLNILTITYPPAGAVDSRNGFSEYQSLSSVRASRLFSNLHTCEAQSRYPQNHTVYRSHNPQNSGPQLRRRHVSAIQTDIVTITRARGDPIICFKSPLSPTSTPSEIRLPISEFTRYQLTPSNRDDSGD